MNHQHHQRSLQLQTPSLNKWKRFASLTNSSRCTIFDIYLVKVWQSPHTRRFFIIWRGVPGFVFNNPNAIAILSLCPKSISLFSSSSTSCKTNFKSGTYPSFLNRPSRYSRNLFTSSYFSWCLSPEPKT